MAARILIVEDEPAVAHSLVELLHAIQPCDVEVAPDAVTGRRRAEAEAWDVVLADERLPGGSGTDLLVALARSRPATRRVLMTAYLDPAVPARAINEARVHAYLQKPWDPEALITQLRALLREATGEAPVAVTRIPPMRPWPPHPAPD